MAKKKSSTEKVVKLCAALIALAEESGLRINITVSPQKTSAASIPALEIIPPDEQIKERKKDDLSWLHSHLTQQSEEFIRLSGHYVAVYRRKIISIGDNNRLVRLSAAEAANVTPQEILVVPIGVRGSDAEEDWGQVQFDLDLA
ncbi:MAG: hypothetical protein ABIH36_00170 [bacterium]